MKEKLVEAMVTMMDPSPLVPLSKRLHILNRTMKELNIGARAIMVEGSRFKHGSLPLWYWTAETMEEIDTAKAFRKQLASHYRAVNDDVDLHNIAETLRLFQR
jgi:hypothetical protein